MLSQSINTEIIKCPDTITQSTLSKTFALLLIEDHEMIEGLIQRGEGRHYGYCHRRHAVMILFFLFKSTTQGMGQSSMFITFRTICKFRDRRAPYLSIMKPAYKHNLLINP